MCSFSEETAWHAHLLCCSLCILIWMYFQQQQNILAFQNHTLIIKREHLQCTWTEVSMQEGQTDQNRWFTGHTHFSFTEHAIVIHCASVMCALDNCTIKKDKSSLLQHIFVKPNLYSGPFCWSYRSPHLDGCHLWKRIQSRLCVIHFTVL